MCIALWNIPAHPWSARGFSKALNILKGIFWSMVVLYWGNTCYPHFMGGVVSSQEWCCLQRVWGIKGLTWFLQALIVFHNSCSASLGVEGHRWSLRTGYRVVNNCVSKQKIPRGRMWPFLCGVVDAFDVFHRSFLWSSDFGAVGQTRGSVPPLREAWEYQTWDKSQESCRSLCSELLLRLEKTFKLIPWC